MTPSEAATVLTVASTIDNRTVTAETATIWASTLRADITVDEACQAIVAHFADSTDYLQPAHINRIVAKWRATRKRDIPAVTPPRDLSEDPRAEIDWQKVWGDAYLAGHTEEQCRVIANTRHGIDEGEPLALEAGVVATRLEEFRAAMATSKPAARERGPVQRVPAMWAADDGQMIADPAGWREAGKDHRTPCTRDEYDALIVYSSVEPFERRTTAVPAAIEGANA